MSKRNNTIERSSGKEQQRACPICGELKTLRGLHGHLRIKHNKEQEEIMELVNQAPVDRGADSEETLTLLDMLKHLNQRYEGLEILEARNCFESDSVQQALMGSVHQEAQEILALLADRGVILEGGDIDAFCNGKLEEEREEDGE